MSVKRPSNVGPRNKDQTPSVADTFRRPDSETTKLTHRLSTSLHRRFKMTALAEERKMGDVIEELIEQWTAQHERKA